MSHNNVKVGNKVVRSEYSENDVKGAHFFDKEVFSRDKG